MTTKSHHYSLKESLESQSRAKLFPVKLPQHLKSNSISISQQPQNNSPKKIFLKGNKKSQSKTSLFNFNPAYMEEIASYGTNDKAKESSESKEKDSMEKVSREIERKRMTLFDSNNYEKATNLFMMKNPQKKVERSKKWSKSVKKSSFVIRTHSPKHLKKNNDYDYNLEKEDDDVIIVRNKTPNSDVVEHFLTLPEDLKLQLALPELKVVSPSKNIEGNYSYYIHGVAKSLRNFIEFDYDTIFSKENYENIKYYYYTSPMIIEDAPKKKLLLIDLDETLVHSEFRNKENYKELDAFVKACKCNVKTFSFSDENCVYFMDVFFRPYLKSFLQEISKYFDLAIFTAAMKNYADTIIDYIDPKNEYFQFRLYRDACIPIQNRLYIKDLRIIKDYDPSNVILMDNSLYSFMNQPSNGMLVNSFYTNHKDNQLVNAKSFLIEHIYPCDDVRKECEKWYNFTKLFYKGTSKENKDTS
jgi:Dullard-like phosphatase family protein